MINKAQIEANVQYLQEGEKLEYLEPDSDGFYGIEGLCHLCGRKEYVEEYPSGDPEDDPVLMTGCHHCGTQGILES